MRVEHKEKPKKPEKFVPDQPIGKVVLLMGFVVASTALFWLAWHNALSTGISLSTGTENVVVVVTTLLAFCLMFCMLAIAEVLISRKLFLFIMAIVAAATLFIFFAVSLWSIVGFLLVALSFLYWRHEVHIDSETRTKFLPHKTIKAGLRMAVSLVLLAASFVYYSSLTTGNDTSDRVTEGLISTGTSVVEGVLNRYYEDRYDPDMTLDNFIREIGVDDIEQFVPISTETGIGEIDAVIEEGLEIAEEGAVVEVRTELLNTFDITADGDDTMRSVVTKVVSRNVVQYTEPYIKFIPAVMAIGLFLLLNVVSFIYREIIKSLGYLVFHVLIWINFIRIEKAHVEVEKVTL